MTLHRFYIEPAGWNPDQLALDEAESRHAREVLRLREGDLISVFNGLGEEIHARIGVSGKRSTPLVAESYHRGAVPATELLLAIAIPKGKNMDLVLQKATELGATGILPLLTTRTVVRLNTEEAADKQEKWQRIVIESCKQCGRNYLPRVHLPQDLSTFLACRPASLLCLIAALSPEARSLHKILAGLPQPPAGALVIVGPEGDFAPHELDAALKHGCEPLSLGPVILRTETAAVYCLSILGHELRR